MSIGFEDVEIILHQFRTASTLAILRQRGRDFSTKIQEIEESPTQHVRAIHIRNLYRLRLREFHYG